MKGDSVVAVKCHLDFCSDVAKHRVLAKYDRFIHLVRNPFDAIVAERKVRGTSCVVVSQCLRG